MTALSILPKFIVHGVNMGFRFYKRHGNKHAWLNFSKSGISTSIKLSEQHTTNFKNGVKRTTINLGDGMKYVWQTSTKKKNGFSDATPMGDVTFTILEWFFRIVGFAMFVILIWVLI